MAIGGLGYAPSTPNATTITAAATGAVIDTPVTNIRSAGVVGITIQGIGAATPVKGVWFRDVDYGTIKNVSINNVADEGVLLGSPCTACYLDGLLLTNCVLNRTRAAIIGALDISGTDHWIDRIETGISGNTEGTVQSVNLYCVALAFRASSCFAQRIACELSDVGVYVSGAFNRFTGCRADLNYGHGWQITASDNQFTNCQGLSNGQATTNTYSNFRAESTALFNLFANCWAHSLVANLPKYGFEDLVSTGTGKNQYVNCFSRTAVTLQYLNQGSNGSGFSWPSGSSKTLAVNSATPSVVGYDSFITANSSPTTITDFQEGVTGQIIRILCGDTNTTIQHNGAAITVAASGNLKLRSGSFYTLIKSGNGWRELSALPLGVTADAGDAAKTLQARLNEETQVWNAPLTVDRAVTLSATGAYAGAKFHIVRTAAATGAFNLNVGTGPLKALTAGQWCDVTYNGSAWALTAFGSL